MAEGYGESTSIKRAHDTLLESEASKVPRQLDNSRSDAVAIPSEVLGELNIKCDSKMKDGKEVESPIVTQSEDQPKLVKKEKKVKHDKTPLEHKTATASSGQNVSRLYSDALSTSLDGKPTESHSSHEERLCKSTMSVQKRVEGTDEHSRTCQKCTYIAVEDSNELMKELESFYDQLDEDREIHARKLSNNLLEFGKKTAEKARVFYEGQVRDLEVKADELSNDLLKYNKEDASKARLFVSAIFSKLLKNGNQETE